MTTKQKKHEAIVLLRAYRNDPLLRRRTELFTGYTVIYTLAEIANDIANRLADSYEEYQQISDYLMKYC